MHSDIRIKKSPLPINQKNKRVRGDIFNRYRNYSTYISYNFASDDPNPFYSRPFYILSDRDRSIRRVQNIKKKTGLEQYYYVSFRYIVSHEKAIGQTGRTDRQHE